MSHDRKSDLLKIVFRILIIISIALTVNVNGAHAATLVLQELHFGEWLIKNNIGFQTVTVNTDGSYSNTPDMIMLSPPTEGIYVIDGLNPSSVITSVDVTMLTPTSSGSGEDFTVDSFTTLSPDTDAGGQTTITLGARIRSSGNGLPYTDGVHTGTLQIDINF